MAKSKIFSNTTKNKAKMEQNHKLWKSFGVKFAQWDDKRTVHMLMTYKSHTCTLIRENPGSVRPDLVLIIVLQKKALT